MRKSISPCSFSPSNILRSCWSLLALPTGALPESPPKPQYPDHHGPCCCLERGGLLTGMSASKGCRLFDMQVVHENMNMSEYVRKLLILRAFGGDILTLKG